MSDSHYIMQEREIGVDAANRIGILLDSIERILKREQETAQAKSDYAGERTTSGDHVAVFAGLPDVLRWRVMVLGCSVEDMNFWVRRDPAESSSVEWFIATEIETGCEANGVTPREALDNYFAANAR